MNQILEKISKALRLGTNNANEHEAQSAILAAQRLMAKYKISEEEINEFLNENEKKEDKVIEEKAENEMNNNKWKRRLMVTIAKNFRCDVYYNNNKLVIVGAKEDILISKRVYLYAKEAILKSFRVFFKNNYEVSCISSSMRNRYKREYALGFIKGLSEKFEAQKVSSELALVVTNPKVKEYINNIHFNGIYHTRISHIYDNHCFNAGRRKGRDLADIDTQMKGEN